MGGQENVENSKWLNFELRTYNADLGRFNNPDPYSQFASAYVGMGNNPVSGVDPTGGLVNNYGYVDFLGLNAQAQLSGFGNTSIRTESLSAAFSNWQDYEDMLFLELRPFGYTGGGDGGGSSIASALQRMGQYDEMMSGKTYYDVNYTKDGKTTLLGTFTDLKSANKFALGVRNDNNKKWEQKQKELLALISNPGMKELMGGDLPSFSSIQLNYPGDKYSSADVYKMIGGKVYQNYLNNPSTYSNSCALRISYALNQAGAPIPYTKGQTGSGADGNWYFYRVSDLANYMTSTYGTPAINGTNKDSFLGHQGIIQFDVSGWSDATGHFTTWDGTNIGHGDYFDKANGIHLWVFP